MERWNRLLTRPALRSGYSGGNRLQFFTDGDRRFRAVWDDIARAEERVWMETYVYEPDAVGRRTRHALAEAAQRGCDVVLIYDSQGSASVTEDFFRPLREAGGTVVPFNPVYPWHRLQRRLMNPLHRDHRKLLIVDDRAAYTGGANISEQYAGTEFGTGASSTCSCAWRARPFARWGRCFSSRSERRPPPPAGAPLPLPRRAATKARRRVCSASTRG